MHPNTVRLYEKWILIPKAERGSNGYRVFTEFHVEQFKLSRIAFKIEILQNGLRKLIVPAMKLSAERQFEEAINCLKKYHNKVKKE